MKFKVGDKIKGINDKYFVTNKNMYLGEVIDVAIDEIEIKVLKHKNSYYVGNVYFAVDPDGNFEIVENLTISQLQSEIDKLSNKVQEEYSNVISNRDKVNYLKEQLKQLKEEKNKPIFNEEEREYLSAVIRPFKNEVESIKKSSSDINGEFIHIYIKGDCPIDFPVFKKGTIYKGMELEKQYTLKELGLDE